MRDASTPKAQWPFPAVYVLVLTTVVLGLCACRGGAKEEPPPSGPTPTPRPLTDLDFLEDMKQRRKDAIRVTDWEAYRDTLIGSRVQWTGWVLHVVGEDTPPGELEVRVDLDPPDSLFRHYDAFFLLPEDQASQLSKDDEITFQGDIREIKELAGTVDLVLTVDLENPLIVAGP